MVAFRVKPDMKADAQGFLDETNIPYLDRKKVLEFLAAGDEFAKDADFFKRLAKYPVDYWSGRNS